MATTTQPPEPLVPELAAVLGEFARATKAAARTVSLYPATHPSIRSSMTRVVNASSRLAAAGEITLVVHPDRLTIDDRAAARPDPAIGELAKLMHDRLIGTLRIEQAADSADWHALLLLLARPPDDLMAQGGIAKAWSLSGRSHFEIREIDYADVLRERAGGQSAEWDRIIANCLQGEGVDLDDRTLASLLEMAGNPEQLGALFERLQSEGRNDVKVGARAAALLQILDGLVRALDRRSSEDVDATLRSVAKATSRLTPEMMLALLSQAQSPAEPDQINVASQVLSRIDDAIAASFVATNVTAQRGATARLAQAFEALVPETDRRRQLLDTAEEQARSASGGDAGFEEIWKNAASMLMSYSDKPYVSSEYARELSSTKTQAVEVDRISDDPAERVQAWLATVSDTSVRDLDRQLLLDLLRLEANPEAWRIVSTLAVSEIERLTLRGAVAPACELLEALVRESGDDGREALRSAAAAAIERLVTGPLVRHVIVHLRKVEETELGPFAKLVHTVGPIVIRPLAEALATEENNRAIRRLREMLLGFGAAGRHSVEQLKTSANPAVRRTAIALLRVFGGREALPEFASMLDDADPQVQREAIRAIVQIGTEDAYAVLERALVGGHRTSRDTIVQQLIGLRDEKAVPLLCYVLNHTSPRGRLVEVHLAIIDSLGGVAASSTSTTTLRDILHRGEWWAPYRTAALRRAAATALRRIGSPDTITVLQEAAARGTRSVRSIAQSELFSVRSRPSTPESRKARVQDHVEPESHTSEDVPV